MSAVLASIEWRYSSERGRRAAPLGFNDATQRCTAYGGSAGSMRASGLIEIRRMIDWATSFFLLQHGDLQVQRLM